LPELIKHEVSSPVWDILWLEKQRIICQGTRLDPKMQKHTLTRQIVLIVVVNIMALLSAWFVIHSLDLIMSPAYKQVLIGNEKLREDVARETNIEKLRSLATALVTMSDEDHSWEYDFFKSTTSDAIYGGIVGGNIIGLMILLSRRSSGVRSQSTPRSPA